MGFGGKGWGCANIYAFYSPRTREAIRHASEKTRRSAPLDYMARGLREEAARSEAYNFEVQRFLGNGWGCWHICAFRSPRTREAIRRASEKTLRSAPLDYMARGRREEAARSEEYNLEVQRFLGKGWGCTSARFTPHAPERPFAAPLKYLTRAITSRRASFCVGRGCGASASTPGCSAQAHTPPRSVRVDAPILPCLRGGSQKYSGHAPRAENLTARGVPLAVRACGR
jgi:hypothetical protein